MRDSTGTQLKAVIAVVVIVVVLGGLIVLLSKGTGTARKPVKATGESIKKPSKTVTRNIETPVKEPQVKHPPQTPNLDYKKISDIIAHVATKKDTGSRDYQGFSKAVKQVHHAMLNQLSENLDLSREEQTKMLAAYSKKHEIYAGSYYNQLKKMRVPIQMGGNRTVVTYETYKSSDEFSRMVGSSICELSTFALKIALGDNLASEAVSRFLKAPCSYALTHLLKPLEAKLKEWAIIRDYTISRLSLQNHLRSAVAELATVEDTFRITWNKRYVKELKLWFWDSTADLKIKINSKVKAGFKLHKFFQLNFDHKNKIAIITLPEPEILSNEVRPEIINMSNGLLVKINEEKITRMIAQGRRWSRNQAIKKGMLRAAKKSSRKILTSIFTPLLNQVDQKYRVEITFQTSIRIGGTSNG